MVVGKDLVDGERRRSRKVDDDEAVAKALDAGLRALERQWSKVKVVGMLWWTMWVGNGPTTLSSSSPAMAGGGEEEKTGGRVTAGT